MKRDNRQVLEWVLIVALLIGVIRILSGCTIQPLTQVRQVVLPPIPIRILDSSSFHEGEVQCDSTDWPIILVKEKFLADSMKPLYARLMSHEIMHVRQIIHYGSCHAFVQRVRESPQFRFHIEAEAYCYVWNIEVENHLAHSWALDDLAEFLGSMVGLTKEDAKPLLPCKEGG